MRGYVNFDNAAIVAIEHGEYARLAEGIANLNQFRSSVIEMRGCELDNEKARALKSLYSS